MGINRLVKFVWNRPNIVVVFLFLIICTNIFVLVRLNNSSKNRSVNNPRVEAKSLVSNNNYGLPCPEIVLRSIDGKTIDFKSYVGDVIVVRFSRFYRTELPDLIFLEHLVGKYQKRGVRLVLINSLGTHYADKISKICHIQSPIVLDNGETSALFNANFEDTIIIDRQFTIKFKINSNSIRNSLMAQQITRWLYDEESNKFYDEKNEIAKSIKELSFYDVVKKKLVNIGSIISEKTTILTIFTSTCMGCEEDMRLKILREAASRMNKNQGQIVVLFGIGNNEDAIGEFSALNGLNELSIVTGVIRGVNNQVPEEYYTIFELEVDPRTFILRKGKVSFIENKKNSRKVSLKYLLNNL